VTKRTPSRWLAAIAAVLLTGWVSICAPTVAQAASADVFDRFEVKANVTTDGYVEVTEVIELRFGSSSGRHGLERTLITREPDGDQHDIVFRIDNIEVTSPSPDVSTALDISDQGSGRNTYTRIRVGSADRTVTTPSATYVLTYRVQGLLRSFSGYDELYWDLTGSSMPAITAAKASITVPGGVQAVTCSVAAPGNQGPCASSAIDATGVAQYTASNIPTGELLTVSAKLKPGLVTNNTPIQVENADTASTRDAAVALAGSTAVAGVVPLLGWLYLRRRTKDYRYAGMPPGTFPPADRPAEEVPSDPKMEIPVSFAPPQLPVADAGLLIDGETQVRDTTATLVGLAVSGAIQLRSDGQQQVRLIDPERAPDDLGHSLLVSLFPEGTAPGTELDLGEPGTLTAAHELVGTLVLNRARASGVFMREPGGSPGIGFGIGGMFFPVVVLGVLGFSFLGSVMFFLLPLLIAVVVTWTVVRRKMSRGQRTAYGRALTDQVEGFRTYLATAEAEQLRFEEGEDIFSRYLPWAIMFDLTERWTQVCLRLVELGRIPAAAPTWYYGNYWSMNSFGSQINDFSSSVAGSVASPPSTSDTGFGSGGSSFSGGGFSGGGGGGGGGGSW
jgi:hypothetical protein